MKARYVLGIDFGTSNLRAHRAVLKDDGQLEVAPQAAALQGAVHEALPAVLELDATGENVIAHGQPALNNLLTSGEGARFVQEFKPCLGQASEDLAAQGKPAVAHFRLCPQCQTSCSPNANFCARCGAKLPAIEEASARVLFRYSQDEAFRWADRMIERVVRDLTSRVYGEPLTAVNEWKVVAGVPVHWQESTRDKFRALLARCFDNENVELVTEPEAALRYHLWAKTVPVALGERFALIVDFGAGTTDVVLGRLSEDGRSLVEAASYGERYGGGDFDVVIATYIAEQLKIPMEEELPLALKQRGKELKEQLSHAVSAGQEQSMMAVSVLLDEQRFYSGIVRLDRPTFESPSVAGRLTHEFESLLSRALTHFEAKPEQVGAIIVTGGGAWWYFVGDVLHRLFPDRPVLIGSEPDKAISKGLALAATFLPVALQPRRGEDVHITLELTWNEAQQGCEKTVDVDERAETVLISSGTQNEQEMRLNGKGRHGQHGGRAGDLVIHIKVGSPPPPPDEDAKVDFDLSAPKTGDAAFTLWRAMTGHVQPVTSVAFSPDGRVIASGSARKDKDLQIDEIRLWDAPTGTWILTIVGEGGRWRWWSPEISGGIHAVAFSPDGKTLACASADGTVKLWDAQTGALRRRVNHNGNVAVAFSPDGATIASASTDMTAKLWDAQTGVLKRTLSGHLAIVQSVAFSPDGTTLASGGIGASLILWDVATGQEKRMLTGFKAELKGLADGVPSVAFSPDGRLLASGCKSSPKKGGFVSWDAKMLTHEGPADVLLWDVESGKLLRTLHAEGVPSVAFSPPDGGLLACGVARKEGGEIRLWNPQTGTLRQTLAGQSGGVRSIAFSPDGKMIVSGTSNGVVEVWRTG